MRHWRSALSQIYEHRATKPMPTYGGQTDTEKALMEALKQLELQCKERIDLLEALRVSREEDTSAPSVPMAPPKVPVSGLYNNSSSHEQGSIGHGTIPAVTYSELSRPALPHRPSAPTQTSLESNNAAAIANDGGAMELSRPASNSRPRSKSPQVANRSERTLRSASPEKHTMRTTLRASKAGEASNKPVRKSPRPAAEGPSKAATLAWSALNSREKFTRAPSGDSSMNAPPLTPRRSSDQMRFAPSPKQWDSHSRRLVNHREYEGASSNGLANTNTSRHSDEILHSRSPLLSVTAASSALSSSSQQDLPSMNSSSNRIEGSAGRAPRGSRIRSKSTADEVSGASGNDDSGETPGANGPVRRKAVSRRPTPALRTLAKDSNSVPLGKDRKKDENKERPRRRQDSSESDNIVSQSLAKPRKSKRKEAITADTHSQSSGDGDNDISSEDVAWKKKKTAILKNLPSGVDEQAAKQILNDIVVQGDEVHWSDIAGLEIAKNALRETVVYPFLRPDLFMGLREPARGMLLFGPPGTGKTMLARAVATESRSTFFSISASSLTSKYLGESEKLVRALFGLARALAPSIIFVDEIDSLLSHRAGSGEHEATRRIKTEFLIQWSDLQRAAAGRETTEKDRERGDANRVLVLAATNLPWAIDEAARRRFVRRQYIPLPEAATRETQIRTLLGQQKHSLAESDIQSLVDMTDGKLHISFHIASKLLTRLRVKGFRGPTLQPWQKTQPWDRFGHSARRCST